MSEMKGLILKDWYLMSRQLKLMVVYVVVFVVIFSFTLDGMGAMTSFLSVVTFLLSINCFAYDEQVHFEKMVAAAPVRPITVVLSRYIASISLGLGASILIMSVNLLTALVRKSPDLSIGESLLYMAAGMGVAIVIVSILFPLIYKYGVNKSRLLMLILLGAPSLVFILLTSVLPEETLSSFTLPQGLVAALPVVLPGAGLVLLAVSIFLSKRIVANKQY